MFGSFAMQGARVVGIPRLADGPDIARLAELAALHKPKLYVINSVLHNPTSTSLCAAKAFQALKIAEQHDITIVEDDISCDLHPAAARNRRRASPRWTSCRGRSICRVSQRRWQRTCGVGFIAASPDIAIQLANRKILGTLTSTDLGERVVYKVLSEGHHRNKHVDRLRSRLKSVRGKTVRQLGRADLKVDIPAPTGIFVWADAKCDTNVLAEKALAQGYLLVPGRLFSPSQLLPPVRMNVAWMADPGVLRFLEQHIG